MINIKNQIFIMIAVLLSAQAVSEAGIVSTTPNITVITPTSSTDWRDNMTITGPTTAYMFQEQKNYTLPAALSVNGIFGGYPSTWALTDGPFQLAAGTIINSYVHHYEVASSTTSPYYNVNGTVTLDANETIIAVIGLETKLGLSNAYAPAPGGLGLLVGGGPGVQYSSSALLGLSGPDTVTANSATSYTFDIYVGNLTDLEDNFRVITMVTPVPEPSTYMTMAGFLLLAGFAYAKRRKKQQASI